MYEGVVGKKSLLGAVKLLGEVKIGLLVGLEYRF